METNEAKISSVELPLDFESIVDVVEYAQQSTATGVSISMQKLGDTTCLFVSADARINHPKKLLKANPGSQKSKEKFARGWHSLGDTLILLTKVTTEDTVAYKINVSLQIDKASEDDSGELCRLCGSVCFDADFELISGADYLEHALAALNLPKKKKLMKLLKMMTNDDEMLTIIPLKRVGAQASLKVGMNGDDIVSKKTAVTFSLKVYLSTAFLIPDLNITVENSAVTDNLWVRSLTQTETRCLTLPVSYLPSADGSDDDRDAKIMMTCGYSSMWPLSSCMLCYHRGRLVQYIVPKKRSRSHYKFLGIIHELGVNSSPTQRQLLDICIEHYLAETDLLRSRPIRVTKVDEDWRRCTACLKWSQVTQALEDGQEATCSNFNMLSSCEDAAGKILPDVGSNKVPPTPATTRKRKRPTAADIRAASPVDMKFARTSDMESSNGSTEEMNGHPPSPHKSPFKITSAVKTSPQTVSPMKEKSPSKKESPMKKKAQTKAKSPKKKSVPPLSPTTSRGSSVFDFNSGSEADVVADSLSEAEEDIGQATPALKAKHNNSSIDTGDTTILSLGTTTKAGGDAGTATNNLAGYYSLSDDEDPRALHIKQLKSELSRTNKRLEMLRSASTKFLNLLLVSEGTDEEPVVKDDASPEEIVSILMRFVEDTEGLQSKLIKKRLSYK